MNATTERPTTTAHVRGDSRAESTPFDPTRAPRSDAEALAQLDDARLILWAVYRGARLTWSVICKRWPDARSW